MKGRPSTATATADSERKKERKKREERKGVNKREGRREGRGRGGRGRETRQCHVDEAKVKDIEIITNILLNLKDYI